MSADTRTDPPTPDPLRAALDLIGHDIHAAFWGGVAAQHNVRPGTIEPFGDCYKCRVVADELRESAATRGVSLALSEDPLREALDRIEENSTDPNAREVAHRALAALPSAPDQRLREALRAVLRDYADDPSDTYLTEAVRIFRAALSEAATSPEPLDWYARRKPDDPFPDPTLPEVEQMLRRRLDPMMVYAMRPTGDPFAGWAKAIIGEATASPEATLDAETLREAMEDAWRNSRYAVMPFPLDVYEDAAARLRGPA